MNTIVVVYVAGALRGNFIKKFFYFRKAKKMTLHLWRKNIAVYSPHLNSGWLDTPETDKFVLPANIEFLKRCDVMLVLDNWFNSEGTKAEISFAKSNNIPVYYDFGNLVYDIDWGKIPIL